tara:strand:- start:429 stop:1076 length:648 start_codon:yes stop_codon:yes gene_type:complete
MTLYYFRTVYGNSALQDHSDIGTDLTSVEDIKKMRTEITDLTVRCVKYIRSNYNKKLADISKTIWNMRGNSDQWTMAIATGDVDGYKRGDVIWCGDPALLCSQNIPFCNISQRFVKLLKKDPNKNVQFSELKMSDDDNQLFVNNTADGSTWIVSYQTLRTKGDRWIKRSECHVYPMVERRIMLFTFGVYDYTGILYDFDESFQKDLIQTFGLGQN